MRLGVVVVAALATSALGATHTFYLHSTSLNHPGELDLVTIPPTGPVATVPALAASGWSASFWSSPQTVSWTSGIDTFLSFRNAMSVPVSGATISGTSAAASIDLCAPGAMVFVAIALDSNQTITAPASWPTVGQTTQGTFQLATYLHSCNPGDPPAMFSWPGPTPVVVRAVVIDGAAPIDRASFGGEVAQTTHVAPSISTTLGNELIFSVHATFCATIPTLLTPATRIASDSFANVGLVVDATVGWDAGAQPDQVVTTAGLCDSLNQQLAFAAAFIQAPARCTLTATVNHEAAPFGTDAGTVIGTGTVAATIPGAGVISGERVALHVVAGAGCFGQLLFDDSTALSRVVLASGAADAGVSDGGSGDGGADSGMDAGGDGGVDDGGVDAGNGPDAGPADSGADAGALADGGPSVDGGGADGGAGTQRLAVGCSCEAVGPVASGVCLLAGAWGWRLRRRRATPGSLSRA